jgi:hypothetical protein
MTTSTNETMTEKQAMDFMRKETSKWAYVIAKRNGIKVIFEKSLGRYRGLCYTNSIKYSRITILANLNNPSGLRDLVIH